uniref:ABC transporter domain-containing protein n=1 Tax=Heterosigma akashiwo TaxID=2829 RepID=A0A7S3XX63_HETAK
MHDEGWTEERGRAELGGKKETAEEKLKDGKKLSNRDKRKLQKEAEKKARDAEYEKAAMAASREGAQFACSQSAVDPNDANWQNALDVIVPSFSISAHNKLLFDNAQLNIVQGRKYGFVGPNGAGKSTLLKMIASKELRIPPKVDCLYVEQEVVADDTPAYEAVLKADKERWALIEEERALTRALDAGEAAGEGAEDRLGEIYARMEEIGADGAESKARRILFGLGFDPKMQSMKTKHFSGGWRMRISLARALFVEPTLLMLDEPTNHLDLNAVIWLDDYLQKWKKTLLIVSHDQDFLNSVCEDIVHLHELRLEYYRGNYDDFKEMECQKRKQQQKDWEKQEKRIRQLKQSGQSKSKATEEVKKKERVRGARAEKKKANQAVAAGQEAQTATELIKRPRDYVVTIAFPDVDELSPPIIEVLDCEFHYPNGPTILKDMNFGIDLDSRICVVGPNGAGKSTLLKLLTGELTPTTGELKRNQRLRMGIYNQHFVDRLPMSLSPVDYIRQEHNEQTYQSTRNLLGRFGLEGHAHTIPMRDLSGGQKARVVFTELSLQHAHILFLDEPTNNLDIESIDALCTAIQNFNGGVVVVTHDARLVEACDCRLWVVDDGGCWAFNGEFEDYKAQLLNDLEHKIQAEEERRAAQQAQRRLKAGGGSSRKAA